MDENKHPLGASDKVKDLLGQSATEQLSAKLGGSDVFVGAAGEELRRALEKVDLASAGLTDSIGRIQDFNPPFRISELNVALPGLPLEPVFSETNERLDELIKHIAVLVDVAKHQSELTQAINESTKATLIYAAQSGDEAKRATKVARWALFATIFSLLISAAIPIYLEMRGESGSELRSREERSWREQEIRILKDISATLAVNARGSQVTPQVPPNSAKKKAATKIAPVPTR